MTLRGRLRRRWDIEAGSELPFACELGQINVGRIELVSLLCIVNNLIEIAFGFGVAPIRLEIPLAIGWIVAVHFLRRAPLRVQHASVIVFIVTAMLSSHLAVYDLATARGVLYSGYLLRLLILSTFFVLPPRLLGTLILIGLTIEAVMLALLPSTLPRLRGVSNAAIVSGIGYVAGWLIHSARRLEHEQRLMIAAQNKRLTAQNAELDQLMAITAHDLRSPLYGLRHLLDLADRRADADPALPRRVLREAVESLDAMQALVSRLLDAHAAEHAPLGHAIPQDLRAGLRAAARRVAPLATASHVGIDLVLPDAPLIARIDDTAFARIIDNLLANAVRHGPCGTSVTITAVARGADAIVAVADTGAGVAPAHQPRLFQKFDRAGSTPGLKSGTGMGLFIAATYAARSGATLRYRPAVPHGAVFEMRLPLVRD